MIITSSSACDTLSPSIASPTISVGELQLDLIKLQDQFFLLYNDPPAYATELQMHDMTSFSFYQKKVDFMLNIMNTPENHTTEKTNFRTSVTYHEPSLVHNDNDSLNMQQSTTSTKIASKR